MLHAQRLKPARAGNWSWFVIALVVTAAGFLYSAQQAEATVSGTGYWHVISREWKKPPNRGSWDEINGGTAAKMIRHSGSCDMWETYGKVRATHAGASSVVDLIWETGVHYEPAQVRDYFNRYLGRTPQCSEFNPLVSNYKKKDVLEAIACSDEAANRGTKPATFCQMATNPGSLGISTQERAKIKDTANHALWDCGDKANRIVVNNLDIDFSRGEIDDIYSAVGRVQLPEDYRNFGASPVRTVPTAKVYELAYTYYMYSGRNLSAITNNSWYLCGVAGKSVAELTGWWAAFEADATMREFCGIVKSPAQKPFGQGPEASVDPFETKANFWGLLTAVATAPGWSTYNGQDEGYECSVPGNCQSYIKAFLDNATNSCK